MVLTSPWVYNFNCAPHSSQCLYNIILYYIILYYIILYYIILYYIILYYIIQIMNVYECNGTFHLSRNENICSIERMKKYSLFDLYNS